MCGPMIAVNGIARARLCSLCAGNCRSLNVVFKFVLGTKMILDFIMG